MTVINAITGQPMPVPEQPDHKVAWQSIRRLAGRGLTASEIADELACCEYEVLRTASKYHIKIAHKQYSKPGTQKAFPDKRLRSLVAQGLTIIELSTLLCADRKTVERRIKTLDLKLVDLNAKLVIEMPPGVSRFAVNRAMLTLQRDGQIVYPAVLFGGAQGRWCVNSRENEMDAARLVAKARRLEDGGATEVGHG